MPNTLINLVAAFNELPWIRNPNDDRNLSSAEFADLADRTTVDRVDAIERAMLDVEDVDAAIAALSAQGIKASRAGDPQDPMETSFQIETNHGLISVPTVELGD